MNNVFWTIEDPEHFAWYGYLTPWDACYTLPLHRSKYLAIYKAEEHQSISNRTIYLAGEDYE
jgi:hypothetical protein